MSGNDVKPRDTSVNQRQVFEPDGEILRDLPQENGVLIFFRRVGRAFADLGGAISRVFSNLADRVRGAIAHVNDAIRGVDRDTALQNVAVNRRDYSTRFFDLDEEASGDENFDVNSGEVLEQSLTVDTKTKNTDFSEIISPTASRTSTEQPPSFETRKNDPDPDLPLMDDDDSKVEIGASVAEEVAPQKTNGDILFDGFHQLDPERKSVEFLSLGSVYMQSDCLEFAQKIVNNSMAIESGGKTEFTKDMLESANRLLKLKRQLDSGEKKRIKEEKALEKQAIIGQKKSLTDRGDGDFNEFFTDFVDHQAAREKFSLYENGKYRINPDLLEFAEKVESDINESEERKQAATYLIRWNKHPEHAEKATNEAIGFSLVPPPPPPPAPPPRIIRTPKVEPVPVPLEQSAIIRLVNADSRHQEQLRGLISFSTPMMRSGLAVLARIWQSDISSSGKDANFVRPQLQAATAEYETYTDLEEIDNAMKLVEAIVGMNTGHSFELSADIGKIKEHRDAIIQKLARQRSQIIGSRKISDVADLTGDQIITGLQRFEDFRNAYVSSSKRGRLNEMKVRDIYFSDECMSYTSHIHANFLPAKNLIDKDRESLEAAGYLLTQYNQFKALTSVENIPAP